ncbi:DapH/DapD/GlmU-related protein [Methanoregula sp.]|jgi:UDP-3-O-[3-hydroxymyristoyl] glucosamine N-acyltransferase|uniref:DapH/DapD/GlmU-related protein n=1 Tax=Methanoregula sp. TaxID=2052170 RepID=UPI003C143611
MSLQKIFQKLKSAEVADSWLMHTLVMQHVVKNGLLVFNYLAPKTRLCQRVKAGSLGKGNSIHPSAIIDYDHVIIGDSCVIGKNVVIEKNTIIGDQVTIEEGVVIGSEGFELRRAAGQIIPVVHLGGVIIHDNVRIGSHTCIDKSSFSEYTEIGASSIILADVEIGHNVKIGQHVTIAESTMIGGYSRIANGVNIGRRCSLSDSLSLGEGVVIPDGVVLTREIKST